MSSKITRLSAADLAELADVRREWLDRAVSTLPADRDEAEFGIALAYERVGMAPPRVAWFPDPALGAAVAATLAHGVRQGLTGQIWADARRGARQEAQRRFRGRVLGEVQEATTFRRDRAEEATRQAALGLVFTTRSSGRDADRFANVDTMDTWRLEQARYEASMELWGRKALWSHVPGDYRARALKATMAAVGAPAETLRVWRRWHMSAYNTVRGNLDHALGQQSQLQVLAEYDALARFSCAPFPDLDAHFAIARNAGWWWPFQGVAVVCERPSVRTVDREGRLHGESGPALAYADGFSAYFWHGRLVPRWAVLEPTVERIGSEGNVEIRRCAIEALGWARFAEQAGLTLVDECADPGNAGQRLSLHAVPGKVWGTPARVLVCTNGSVDLDGGRHTFGLLVPPTVPSALAAAAWGYGLTADEYALLQRRA